MFTGLIQGLGTIEAIGTENLKISCHSGAELVLTDLALGDSVAVDGVCLTVVEILPRGFVAIASPETLDRTTLGKVSHTYVNLETSVRVGSKLGGHFVTGHVDAIGCLQQSIQTASSWEMTFTAPPASQLLWQRQIAPYIVPKGSIAVNGISLTIADCDEKGTYFTAAVIPHSYGETNLRYLQLGHWVNLEADILGKYVGKFIRSRFASPIEENPSDEAIPSLSGFEAISPAFLAEHGYL
ncbi:riboflavin synthase [Laspinema sp. D1]|uniref:riboflavin synthase n=1 Tax=Laspinema palackyanum TaxID=3231601 RepID=UPI003484A617|nr:riboflavin synthase [Laspinema sp. D2b]